VAIIEDDRLVELLVDRADHKRIIGDSYLGRVEAVLPGIQAAFVDIGLEKSAFLHASDLLEPEEDDDPDDPVLEPEEIEATADGAADDETDAATGHGATSDKGNGKAPSKRRGEGGRREVGGSRRAVPDISELLKK